MGADWTRREFVAGAAASIAFAGTAGNVDAWAAGSASLGGRFLRRMSRLCG